VHLFKLISFINMNFNSIVYYFVNKVCFKGTILARQYFLRDRVTRFCSGFFIKHFFLVLLEMPRKDLEYFRVFKELIHIHN
jgi:hypothetical protein